MSVLKIEQWCDLSVSALTGVVRESPHGLSSAIVDDTPIDTTALARSWTPNIGSMEVYDVPHSIARKTSNFRDWIKPVTDKLKIGDVYYFGNPKPYAPIIEYDAHSAQARAGMMRINIAKWQGFVDVAVRNNIV